MKRSSLESPMLRSRRRAALALALAGGLVLSSVSGLRAQDEPAAGDDGKPAWERIADKLSPNSLEDSSPEELPSVILPGDDAGAEAPAGEEGGGVDAMEDEGTTQDDAPVAPEDIIRAAEAALEADERGIDEGELDVEMEPSAEAEVEAEEDVDMLEGRMDASAPGTVGLPQAGRQGRGAANINLGRESQDDGKVVNLFDDPEVRRMLGDKPRFIYGALRSPDPMIFPPVRNAAIYAELSMEAERLIKQGKLEEAQKAYKRILDLNDKRYALEMRNKIAQLNNRLGAARMVLEEDQMIEVKLPVWVRTNTRGVLYDETDPMVLVGDFTLRIGDPIPSHPEVRVEAISKRSVKYRVADRQSFNVAVKGFQE